MKAAAATPEPDDFPVEKSSSPPTIAFTDRHVAELASLRSELTDAERALVISQRTWDELSARTDVTAYAARDTVAARIRTLTSTTQQTAVAIAEVEASIAVTTRLADQYAQRVQADGPIVAKLEAALTVLRDHLDWSAAESAWFDRTSQELLARTGDRAAFRRPALDPRRVVREGLDDLLRSLERQRLRKLARVESHLKPAS